MSRKNIEKHIEWYFTIIMHTLFKMTNPAKDFLLVSSMLSEVKSFKK